MITLAFFHQFQDELNAAKSLVETHCIIGRSIANQSFMEEKFDRFSPSGQSDNNEFEDFLPPLPNAKHRQKGRISSTYSNSTSITPTSTALDSESLRLPSETLRGEMHESKSEFERSKAEFKRENEQLRKTNVKLQRERKQDQETIDALRTENQQLNAKIHSLYERILEQK